MKKTVLVIASLLFLIPSVWFIAIPESFLSDLIENALNMDYIYLRPEGMKKGSFYNFSADSISLMRRSSTTGNEEPLFVFRNMDGRLDFSSLFRLNPGLSFKGRINNGEIKGTVRPVGKDRVSISGADISISGIPQFQSLGIYGDGILSGTFLVSGNTGELKFSVREAKLKNTLIGEIFLPLELFHDIRGHAIIDGDSVDVKSLSMAGAGIYARVRGRVKRDNLDLSLEMMTDSMFKSETLLSSFLERYRVSPGYYVVPLKGLLGKG